MNLIPRRSQMRQNSALGLGLWVLLTCLVCTALLCRPAMAQVSDHPDDQYVQIFNIMQQAETLQKQGKAAASKAKYEVAYNALLEFQKVFPEWNPKLIAYRIGYLANVLHPTNEVESATSSTNAAASPKPKTGKAAASVKLLEPGAEPRVELRLHPKLAEKQALKLTIQTTMATKMGEAQTPGVKIPSMILDLELEVKEISDAGQISYELTFVDATVSEEPGVLPQMAEAVKASLGSLKGFSTVASVSDRGLSKAVDLKVPAGSDPTFKQTLEQIRDSISHLIVPLPEEAVGAGAKWQVTSKPRSQGIAMEQTANYEITAINGDSVTTKVSIDQRAGNQKIENPAMPGMKMDLSKLSGKSTMDIALDLGRILPAKGSADSSADLDMVMNMGGQKQPLAIKTTSHLIFESKQ